MKDNTMTEETEATPEPSPTPDAPAIARAEVQEILCRYGEDLRTAENKLKAGLNRLENVLAYVTQEGDPEQAVAIQQVLGAHKEAEAVLHRLHATTIQKLNENDLAMCQHVLASR